MLFWLSFSAMNALLIATVTQLEVLKGDYSSCKMPPCWLKSSAGANASTELSNICSECSTRGLGPGTAGVESQQHWGPSIPTQGQRLEALQGSARGSRAEGERVIVTAERCLRVWCLRHCCLCSGWVPQRGRQSSGCTSQEGQTEQLRSFMRGSPRAGNCTGISTPYKG